MQDNQWNENIEPKLSLEKAEDILINVYKAAGISPPENCAEILRSGRKNPYRKGDT